MGHGRRTVDFPLLTAHLAIRPLREEDAGALLEVTRPENASARAVSERLGVRFEGLLPYFGDDDGRGAVYRLTAEHRHAATPI